VEKVLSSSNETMERKYDLESRGFTLDKTAIRVVEVLGMKLEDVWAAGRYRHIVEARSLLRYWAVRELGITMSSIARKLNISVPVVRLKPTFSNNYQLGICGAGLPSKLSETRRPRNSANGEMSCFTLALSNAAI